MRVFNKKFLSRFIQLGPKTDDIRSWKRFHDEVRVNGPQLLQELHRFPRSILVAGCQRSGTTMLARTLTNTDCMYNYHFGIDDELDAAQILSGYVHREYLGRCCFQTTYLNECFAEYYERESDFKLVWVLRNPFSVTYSMIYNWGRYAFDELFDAVGATLLSPAKRALYERKGQYSIPKIERSCLSYSAKVGQIFTIFERLGPQRVMVVDYDDLVAETTVWLPKLYDFVELIYKPEYASMIHGQSTTKADKLSDAKRAYIAETCMPVYNKARSLIR